MAFNKKEYYKRWQKNNKEKIKGYTKRYKRDKLKAKDWSLRHLYNLTLEQYGELCNKQNGQCAICGKITKLFVDHDHNINRIRGLLCHKCNVAISFLDENTLILLNAIKYLESNNN